MAVKSEILEKLDSIGHELVDEAFGATLQFPPFHSAHEGLAVIREEYTELECEVFKKQSEYDMANMRREAIQLGAMALRFIYDVVEVR